jgi:hypothetical protein
MTTDTEISRSPRSPLRRRACSITAARPASRLRHGTTVAGCRLPEARWTPEKRSRCHVPSAPCTNALLVVRRRRPRRVADAWAGRRPCAPGARRPTECACGDRQAEADGGLRPTRRTDQAGTVSEYTTQALGRAQRAGGAAACASDPGMRDVPS